MRFGKIFTLTVALLLFLSCFASCNKDEPVVEDVYYTVTFDSNGGSAVEAMKVKSGGTVTVPAEPEKEGYIFAGWRNGAVDWSFGDNKVTSDITLTAAWIDATTVFQYVVNDEQITVTKYIGDMALIRLPNSMAGFPVTSVAANAFENTKSEDVYRIILGENITSVGDSAFSGCEGIEIIVEGGLVSIGEKAFYGCDGLTSVTFGEGAQTVSYGAFSGCTSLKTVVLSGTVTKIDESAFANCSALQSVMLHSSLKSVGDSAFLDCEAMKAVYYYGTAEEWAQTEIAKANNGNTVLTEANFYIYSETEPTEGAQGQYWHFEKNGKIRIW